MDRVLRSAILNSNVIDVIQDNKRPFDELMSKYRCAIMEIETKFKVLNEQYSLQYDRNPIETIKTRLKSMESISRKLAQKGKSFSAKSMEENLDDIANATTENVLSKIEYCLVAEITPIGIAINSCSMNATAATKNEFHTNLPMTSVTGIL